MPEGKKKWLYLSFYFDESVSFSVFSLHRAKSAPRTACNIQTLGERAWRPCRETPSQATVLNRCNQLIKHLWSNPAWATFSRTFVISPVGPGRCHFRGSGWVGSDGGLTKLWVHVLAASTTFMTQSVLFTAINYQIMVPTKWLSCLVQIHRFLPTLISSSSFRSPSLPKPHPSTETFCPTLSNHIHLPCVFNPCVLWFLCQFLFILKSAFQQYFPL